MKKVTRHTLTLTAGTLSVCFGTGAYADFIGDSHATLAMRNLYFSNDYRDGKALPSRTEEWAQGFLFNYTSGFTDGTVGFGLDATALLGVTLNSGQGRHGNSTMIPSDGNGAVSEWSDASPTAKLRLGQTELRYGLLAPKIPVLLSSDGRLLPQEFHGGQITSKDLDHFTFTGGVLEKVTGRASTDQTGMAVPGGTRQSNKFYYAGTDWQASQDLLLQYYVGNLANYYTQNFLGLSHVLAFDTDSALSTDLRYFRTRSSGANGHASGRADGYVARGYTHDNSGEIDNDTWSAAFTYKYRAHALTLGHESVSDASNFVQNGQGSLPDKGAGGSNLYLWTDRMVLSFNRAGEQTNFAQYAYDFAALGLPGLTTSVIYLKGTGIKTASAGDQSEWERDAAISYVIQNGTFKGVGFTWKNGMARSQATRNSDQNRVIINYSLALF